jgi:M6 family metalloprotease-like protein
MIKFIKKLSLFLVITLIINSFTVIKSKADVKSETQEFTNVVIFVDFFDSTDNFMDGRRDKIIEMYDGTSVKSLSKYISTISNGKMQINNYFPQDDGQTIVPYRLSKPRSYYNNTNEYEMIKEIIAGISVNSNIPLDMNNDGQVDNVTFIFEGSSSDRSEVFWPHKNNHNNGSSINGKTVNTYNVHNSNSIFEKTISGGKGVIAHEFLHSLGLPDLYRSSGIGTPVGEWDIMAHDSIFLQYPLAYLRKDWVGIDTITESGSYTLEPVSSNPDKQAFIIKTPLSEKEFFVVEYRKQGNPYNDELEGRIPGSGLIVYRVNTEESSNFNGDKDFIYIFRPGETGEGNAEGEIKKAFLSEESGRTSYGTSDMSAKITDGAITYSSGLNSGIVIKNVSSAGDTISFDIEIQDLSSESIWNLVGNETVNSDYSYEFSMDVVNNEIYVAYTEGNYRSTLKVKKFDGTSWTNVGDSISNDAYEAKIKVYNGVPYVLYHDYDYKLVMVKFENGAWTKQYITNELSQFSEMISTENGLYIAYTEPNETILKVAKLNEDTDKFEQIGENVANGSINNISFTEENGIIYIAYSDIKDNSSIHIKKYDGMWTTIPEIGIASNSKNIIVKDGNIYLAVAPNDSGVKVYEFKNNSWSKLGDDVTGVRCMSPNLQLINDTLYISYSDYSTGEIKVKLFDGTSWIEDGYRVTDKTSSSLNFEISNGIGYIGYKDNNGIIEIRSRKLKEVSTEPQYDVEDVDKNGIVDIEDIAKVALKYNVDISSDSFEDSLDINKDNIIDIFDIVLVSKKLQ